jgi:predicted aspartyl protease
MSRSKKTSVPLLLLDMGESGYHVCLEVTINRKKCRMVLDTGASRTVLDKTEIKRLVREEIREVEGRKSAGLGTDGMTTHATKINRFKIKSLLLPDLEVLVLDLSILNHSYHQIGHEKVAGVLGSDLLRQHKAKIDFDKNRLVLYWKE